MYSEIQVRLNPDTSPTGSDLSIVNAARRSFNTRSDWDRNPPEGLPNGASWRLRLKEKDKRLLEFLARGMTADDFDSFVHKVPAPDTEEHTKELKEMLWQWRNTPTHDTPFNHCFISFEVKAPIFVARQLVKHEYLILSEFSRRYITNNVEFYKPDTWRNQSKNKKQGSSGEHPLFNHGKGTGYREEEFEYNKDCLAFYSKLVNMGVAIEQARMVLPQSTMTEWTWSGTLGAFAKMCTLRLHPEAQYEARIVAKQVYSYLQEFWPVGAKALVEGPDL